MQGFIENKNTKVYVDAVRYGNFSIVSKCKDLPRVRSLKNKLDLVITDEDFAKIEAGQSVTILDTEKKEIKLPNGEFIVKVQQSMTSNVGPSVLVYNEGRSVRHETQDSNFVSAVRSMMGERPKAYFNVKLETDGTLVFLSEVGPQKW